MKQHFAEDCPPAGQRHSRTPESPRESRGDTQPPGDTHLSRGDPRQRLLVTWRMTGARLRLPGHCGGSSLPRGDRLCATATGAPSQMVLPPRMAWVAFGQCYPSSRLTVTATALMTNSGSHMLLIIPSFSFWYKALQTSPLPRDRLFQKNLSDFNFIFTDLLARLRGEQIFRGLNKNLLSSKKQQQQQTPFSFTSPTEIQMCHKQGY